MNNNILQNEEFKKKFPIELVPHNKLWKIYFNEMNKYLNSLLKNTSISIHHIGSTAIPNIYSKNIIDILIEVQNDKDFSYVVNTLTKKFEFRWCEENRAFFVDGYGDDGFDDKVFHIHIRKKGDIDEVYFLKYILQHPEIAKEYEKLKLSSEKQYKNDREGYTNSKTAFIKKYTKLGEDI